MYFFIHNILKKSVDNVDKSIKKGKPLPAPKRSTSHNYDHANLNNKYKFDTFVVGSNNKFLLAVYQRK